MSDSPAHRESAVALPAAPAASENPFPGFRPFFPGEEHLFFGRERQVDAMVEKLAKTRFLAVVGTSGSGKSSLVNCGLLPALFRGLMTASGPSWRVVQFRPGANPLQALAGALASHEGLLPGYRGSLSLSDVIETHLRLSSRGLVDVVKKVRLSEQTNLLVVADQFEEVFRYRGLRRSPGLDSSSPTDDATALVKLLLEALTPSVASIYVLLTMRSDFLGDCSRFEGLPEAINESQYLVPRLTREERRAAISGPVAVSGAEIDSLLLTRLLNEVGDNPDQLSVLQHALNRTWARWKYHGEPDRPISLEDYTSIGTMVEALDRHADKAYHELPEGRPRAICERLFKALTDTGTDARGIRRPAEMSTLGAVVGASPAELAAVIGVFRKPSRSFLMPPSSEQLNPDTVIDISHESLMRVWQRLRAWTEEEARSARIYRRLVDSAVLNDEGHASLWRDPELQLALEWRRQSEPSAAWGDLYATGFDRAMRFLDRSRDARDHELAEVELTRRWSRWRMAPALVSLALLLVCMDWFFISYSDRVAGTLGEWLEAPGVLPGWAIRGLARAGAVIPVFTAISMPAVLLFVAFEYYGRHAYRRSAMGPILQRLSESHTGRLQEAAPASDEVVAVSSHVAYASVGARLLAGLIDGGLSLVFFMFSLIAVATIEVGIETARTGDSSSEMTDLGVLLGVVFWVILTCLYQAVSLSTTAKATPGMRAADIVVVATNGQRLSFSQAALRHLAKIVSYGALGLGLLVQLFTQRRQALHDILSRSVVLKESAEHTVEQPGAVARPAPTSRRILACAIDASIAVVLMVLVVAIGSPFAGEELSDFAAGVEATIWGLVYWSYQTWTISAAGATLGMRAGGIYVADTAGRRLSFARSAWRHLAKVLSYGSVVGLIMQPFTTRKQALHDLLAGSVVLTKRPPSRPSAAGVAT